MNELEIKKCMEKLYAMRDRCNPKHKDRFPEYAGRGIEVREEWRNKRTGRKAWLAWCEQSGFRLGLTIDRKDNDKGYTPENCQWVTDAEQNRNRRNVVQDLKLIGMIKYMKSKGYGKIRTARYLNCSPNLCDNVMTGKCFLDVEPLVFDIDINDERLIKGNYWRDK